MMILGMTLFWILFGPGFNKFQIAEFFRETKSIRVNRQHREKAIWCRERPWQLRKTAT